MNEGLFTFDEQYSADIENVVEAAVVDENSPNFMQMLEVVVGCG